MVNNNGNSDNNSNRTKFPTLAPTIRRPITPKKQNGSKKPSKLDRLNGSTTEKKNENNRSEPYILTLQSFSDNVSKVEKIIEDNKLGTKITLVGPCEINDKIICNLKIHQNNNEVSTALHGYLTDTFGAENFELKLNTTHGGRITRKRRSLRKTRRRTRRSH